MDSCMIWLLKPDHPKATEFAPAMTEGTGVLPGLPAVTGKPVHIAFDGGRLTGPDLQPEIRRPTKIGRARTPVASPAARLPSVLSTISDASSIVMIAYVGRALRRNSQIASPQQP